MAGRAELALRSYQQLRALTKKDDPALLGNVGAATLAALAGTEDDPVLAIDACRALLRRGRTAAVPPGWRRRKIRPSPSP